MVEISKVIAYNIQLLDQIFDDKNKNSSIKENNNNQVCMGGISNWLAFVSVFLMIIKIDVCDIPLRSHLVCDDNNQSRHAITRFFNHGYI